MDPHRFLGDSLDDDDVSDLERVMDGFQIIELFPDTEFLDEEDLEAVE